MVSVGVEIRRVGRHHGRVRWVLRVREGNGLLMVVRRVCGVHRRLWRVRLRVVMAVVLRWRRRGLLLLLRRRLVVHVVLMVVVPVSGLSSIVAVVALTALLRIGAMREQRCRRRRRRHRATPLMTLTARGKLGLVWYRGGVLSAG